MTSAKKDELPNPDRDTTTVTGSKPSYQAPVVLPLWEIRRGLGICSPTGASDTVLCFTGASDHDCYDGSSATDNCSTGTVGSPP